MKLILGTVQLGINYGIQQKKPTFNECKEILNFCLNNKILTFDTAQCYGNSEQLLSFVTNNDSTRVITKIDFNDNSNIDYMINMINKSRMNLNIKIIDTLLLHSFKDFENSNLVNNLIKIKELGFIRKLGVSVYNINEAKKILQEKNFSVLQIPLNYLDHQWNNVEFQNTIKSNNIEIHCRSIFLQGLLINDFKYWSKINSINSKIIYNKIEDLCKKFNLSKLELAIGYIKSVSWVDGIIFGIDNICQLKEIFEHFNNIEKINNTVVNNILENFSEIPKEIINPRVWT